MANPPRSDGLLVRLQNIAATLMAMLGTRLELLGNEIEVEKLRVLRMLMLAQALMFAAMVAILLTVTLLALWLWEFRLGVLGVFALVFLVCAWLAYRALMRLLARPEAAFAATLGELREDLRRLKAASGGHATTPD